MRRTRPRGHRRFPRRPASSRCRRPMQAVQSLWRGGGRLDVCCQTPLCLFFTVRWRRSHHDKLPLAADAQPVGISGALHDGTLASDGQNWSACRWPQMPWNPSGSGPIPMPPVAPATGATQTMAWRCCRRRVQSRSTSSASRASSATSRGALRCPGAAGGPAGRQAHPNDGRGASDRPGVLLRCRAGAGGRVVVVARKKWQEQSSGPPCRRLLGAWRLDALVRLAQQPGAQ